MWGSLWDSLWDSLCCNLLGRVPSLAEAWDGGCLMLALPSRLFHVTRMPQNKVDLVTEAAALNQHETIQRFIQGTIAEGAPVVPISAQLKYNVDAVRAALWLMLVGLPVALCLLPCIHS